MATRKHTSRTGTSLAEEIKTLKQTMNILQKKINDPDGAANGLEFQVTGPKPLNPNYHQKVYGRMRMINVIDQDFMEELLPVLEKQLIRLQGLQEANSK